MLYVLLIYEKPDDFARIERHITVQSGLDGPLWGRGEARYWPNGVPPGAGQATDLRHEAS